MTQKSHALAHLPPGAFLPNLLPSPLLPSAFPSQPRRENPITCQKRRVADALAEPEPNCRKGADQRPAERIPHRKHAHFPELD